MEILKNYPKWLKIYILTATTCKNYKNLSKHKTKQVVRMIKKSGTCHWLSLDTGVDTLFKEYVGMIQALRIIKEDRAVGCA